MTQLHLKTSDESLHPPITQPPHSHLQLNAAATAGHPPNPFGRSTWFLRVGSFLKPLSALWNFAQSNGEAVAKFRWVPLGSMQRVVCEWTHSTPG